MYFTPFLNISLHSASLWLYSDFRHFRARTVLTSFNWSSRAGSLSATAAGMLDATTSSDLPIVSSTSAVQKPSTFWCFMTSAYVAYQTVSLDSYVTPQSLRVVASFGASSISLTRILRLLWLTEMALLIWYFSSARVDLRVKSFGNTNFAQVIMFVTDNTGAEYQIIFRYWNWI